VIAEDIRKGAIKGLTVRLAKTYGLTTDNNIRIVQHKLRKMGLLEQRGARFVAAS